MWKAWVRFPVGKNSFYYFEFCYLFVNTIFTNIYHDLIVKH